MTILDTIADRTRERVAEAKRICPDPMKDCEVVLRRSDLPIGVDTREPFRFRKALQADHMSFICEVKKASPSKGVIADVFPYAEIGTDYDNAGADAISVLTEPYWFMGSNAYLTEIRKNTDIPILRKDFTVDPYMIYEAKAIGADAVLLICAILSDAELKDYLQLSRELGLSAIVEAHSADEITMAIHAGADIIGVNNRNLKDFTVDVKNAGRLRDMVPESCVFISESGVHVREDVIAAEEMHADAVLVGESLMRAGNRARKLITLRGEGPKVKICGLMKPDDIRKVNELQPDFAGFVFAHSRHHVTREAAREMKALLDPKIRAVGVFADAEEEEIISLLNDGIIDLAQLHGNESDETVARIQRATGKRVIKACVMKNEESVKQVSPHADYMLYDAGKGDGRTFNWEWLKASPEKPFFLAGGLTPENVAEGIRAVQPWAVDVSSAVEDEDLSKNYEKMKRFIEAARSVRYEG